MFLHMQPKVAIFRSGVSSKQISHECCMVIFCDADSIAYIRSKYGMLYGDHLVLGSIKIKTWVVVGVI